MIIWATLLVIYRFLPYPLQLFSWSFTACALRLKSIWICEFYKLKYSRFSNGSYVYHLNFLMLWLIPLFMNVTSFSSLFFPSRTLQFKWYLSFCSMLVAWYDVEFRGQLVGVLGNQTQVVRFGGKCLYLVYILLDLLIFHLNIFNCQIMIGCEN